MKAVVTKKVTEELEGDGLLEHMFAGGASLRDGPPTLYRFGDYVLNSAGQALLVIGVAGREAGKEHVYDEKRRRYVTKNAKASWWYTVRPVNGLSCDWQVKENGLRPYSEKEQARLVRQHEAAVERRRKEKQAADKIAVLKAKAKKGK